MNLPFAVDPLAKTALALVTAFVLGGAIGFERQWRQRTAGLRTNVLVAVGAAAFVDLGMQVGGASGSVLVISYVVTGIGFLGAGVIMKEGAQVRGINTAATLWASAAVGAFAGTGRYGEAVLVTALILSGNTLLRPLANYINRRPLTSEGTEAVYRVLVVCRPENVSDARERLSQELEKHHYPIRDIETLSETEEMIELAATLVPNSADPHDLDAVTQNLERLDEIESATWTVSAES